MRAARQLRLPPRYVKQESSYARILEMAHSQHTARSGPFEGTLEMAQQSQPQGRVLKSADSESTGRDAEPRGPPRTSTPEGPSLPLRGLDALCQCIPIAQVPRRTSHGPVTTGAM